MRRGTTKRLGLILALILGPIACGLPDPKPVAVAPIPVATATPTTQARSSTYVVLRLKARRVDLFENDVKVASFPIAVGRQGHETPTGQFHVEEKIVHPDFQQIDPSDPTRVLKHFPPGPQNPLGERWIGFAHGPGWTIGMHGTPHPELLGRAVSGGCIRMRNADVIRVYDAVEIGTRVTVEP